MHNVQETQKTVSKQTSNIVFATSILAILVDFALEFCYQLLTLYRDWYQKKNFCKNLNFVKNAYRSYDKSPNRFNPYLFNLAEIWYIERP